MVGLAGTKVAGVWSEGSDGALTIEDGGSGLHPRQVMPRIYAVTSNYLVAVKG